MRYLLLSILLFSFHISAETLSTRLRDVANSKASAEAMITSLQQRSPQQLTTEDYLVMAEGYQTLGNREAALDAVNKAENSAATPYLRALSLYSKAQIHGILYQDAEMALQQLLQSEQLLLNESDSAAQLLLNDVLSSFASAHNLQGDLKQALHYAERSLALAKALKNPSRELNALILSGRIALQNNQYQHAFSHLKNALSLATILKDEEQLASIHFRLGMAHRKLEQHDDALIHFKEAADRYLQLNRMSNYSYVLVYMAETYLEDPNQISQAETLLQEALTLAEQSQNMTRSATVYYSLGRAALLRKNLQESEAYYQQALQRFRQINSRSLMAETSLALVELLIEQQRYADANVILNELAPDIDSYATFLQLRYAASAAQLAAAIGDWQRAYQLQDRVIALNRQELTNQIQHNITELKEGLAQVSSVEQAEAAANALQQALTEAQRRQLLLQSLLVAMIFVAFVLWQLYRRKQAQVVTPTLPDVTPRHWSQFREKVKSVSQQQPVTLLVLLPRFRATIQRQHGRKIIAELLNNVEQQLVTPEIKASFRGPEMLWLALASDTDEIDQHILEQATAIMRQGLQALNAEPAILTITLPLAELLGSAWHKDDLNALTEAVWLGWFLAEQQPVNMPIWQLQFNAATPRPCEWLVEDVRADMLNACRLGELQLTLNGQRLHIPT